MRRNRAVCTHYKRAPAVGNDVGLAVHAAQSPDVVNSILFGHALFRCRQLQGTLLPTWESSSLYPALV